MVYIPALFIPACPKYSHQGKLNLTDPNEIRINCKKVEKKENVGVATTDDSPVSYNLERQ